MNTDHVTSLSNPTGGQAKGLRKMEAKGKFGASMLGNKKQAFNDVLVRSQDRDTGWATQDPKDLAEKPESLAKEPGDLETVSGKKPDGLEKSPGQAEPQGTDEAPIEKDALASGTANDLSDEETTLQPDASDIVMAGMEVGMVAGNPVMDGISDMGQDEPDARRMNLQSLIPQSGEEGAKHQKMLAMLSGQMIENRGHEDFPSGQIEESSASGRKEQWNQAVAARPASDPLSAQSMQMAKNFAAGDRYTPFVAGSTEFLDSQVPVTEIETAQPVASMQTAAFFSRKVFGQEASLQSLEAGTDVKPDDASAVPVRQNVPSGQLIQAAQPQAVQQAQLQAAQPQAVQQAQLQAAQPQAVQQAQLQAAQPQAVQQAQLQAAQPRRPRTYSVSVSKIAEGVQSQQLFRLPQGTQEQSGALQDSRQGEAFSQGSFLQGISGQEEQPAQQQVLGRSILFGAENRNAEESQNQGAAPSQTNSSAVSTFQQAMQNVDQPVRLETAPLQQAREDFDIPRQIVDQARLVRSGENTEMVIRLKPEHLGDLTLKISVSNNGAVTASFYSDNAQVRSIVENSLVQLRQELENQGIKVDKAEVYAGLSDGQLPQDQGQQAWQQNQGNSRTSFRSMRSDMDSFDEASAVTMAAEEVMEDGSMADGVDYRV